MGPAERRHCRPPLVVRRSHCCSVRFVAVKERGKMRKAWLLFAAVLVTGVVASPKDSETHRVKRQQQFFDIATRLGPNNEVIITCDGRDVVFATGNNAQTVTVGPGQFVKRSGFSVSICEIDASGNEVEVTLIGSINQYSQKRCNPPPGENIVGPGTLYVSDGQALYMNDGCVVEMNIINQAVSTAPSPIITFDVESATDGGMIISNVIVNEGTTEVFEFTVTGARAMNVGPGDVVRYAGGTIISQGETFSGINEFAVVARGADGRAQFRKFDSSSAPINVRGPGQVYIGEDKAAFIGDLGSGTTSSSSIINQEIVRMEFTFSTSSDGSMTVVTGRTSNPITVISGNTTTFEIPGASFASYSSTSMDVSIATNGGQIFNFNGISRFTVYDNNEVTVNPDNFDFSTGGTMFTDSTEHTAVFITDSNMQATEIFESFIPSMEEVSYEISPDSDNVRILNRITGSPPDTETESIQTITGSYVMNVASSETVVYNNNEIEIQNFDGTPRVRIGQVDELITNTATTPSGEFTTGAPSPFSGPGTISYSRGTAFYTTDSDLGNTIGFQSGTAPIPSIRYEATPIGVNEVDGVNYTVSTVTQTIGGDRVINYEATSYTTTTEQEVVYADNLVTVHSPIFTQGGVSYSGTTQGVVYNDRDGNIQVLSGVTTFNRFSGGDVITTTSPNNAVALGPGKIYVSEDEMTVTFSSSDIITEEIADLIRGSPTDFEVGADQFSSIYTGVYNRSTDSATVTYPGGGVIYYSTYNGSRDALYVDDERIQQGIKQAVSSLLTLTKSVPAKETGIIRLIFNGREIFPYSPVLGNNEFRIPNGGSFNFVNMNISGKSLPGGPYSGYSMITVFDGAEVKQVNSSTVVQQFDGPGLLLLPQDSNKAFYTTFNPAVNYLRQSIRILRNFLVSPEIREGSENSITTKNRMQTVDFGTDITAFEGADITFNCTVEGGRPEPTVGFYRILADGTAVKLNDTMDEIVIEDNTLTLLSVRMDDQGQYVCIASNGVPPDATASSTLTVREAVAPELQPGWYPSIPNNNQKLLFPDSPAVMETVNLREFDQLALACRVDGRPKAMVDWFIDDVEISNALTEGYQVYEPVQGRSVLVLDLKNTFNETLNNPLLGLTNIKCSASNFAGDVTEGEVNLQGEIIECNSMAGMDCSTTCGFGLQDVIFMCILYDSEGPGTPIDISEVPFSVEPLIGRQRVCTTSDAENNVVICPLTEFRWNTSEWSGCSKTCNGGVRTRNVFCLEETFPISARYFALVDMTTLNETEDGMCAMSEKAGPRPSERELCETQECPSFQLSNYGECSETCGGGLRQRTVECVLVLGKYEDMNGKTQLNVTVLNDSFCGGEKPSEFVACNNFACFYQWRPGQYGDCGENSLLTGAVAEEFSCRERPVICINVDGDEVNDTSCDSRIRPSSFASCGGGNCFVGIWGTTGYSPCSETCGYGVQTRSLLCYSPDTMTLVPIDFCDVTKTPASERNCFVRNCENMCTRDENQVICPVLANMELCNSPYAMANNGTRCCASCMGMAGAD